MFSTLWGSRSLASETVLAEAHQWGAYPPFPRQWWAQYIGGSLSYFKLWFFNFQLPILYWQFQIPNLKHSILKSEPSIFSSRSQFLNHRTKASRYILWAPSSQFIVQYFKYQATNYHFLITDSKQPSPNSKSSVLLIPISNFKLFLAFSIPTFNPNFQVPPASNCKPQF